MFINPIKKAEDAIEKGNKELDKEVDRQVRKATRSRFTLAWYLLGVTVIALLGAGVGILILEL